MSWLVLHVLCQSRVHLNHEPSEVPRLLLHESHVHLSHERSEVPRLVLHESRVHLNHELSEVPRLVLHVLCQSRVLAGTFLKP